MYSRKMSNVHFKKNWKRITYYINLHCTLQTKQILKILEGELSSLLAANNEVDASIAGNSEQLEKEQQELSEIKTNKKDMGLMAQLTEISCSTNDYSYTSL